MKSVILVTLDTRGFTVNGELTVNNFTDDGYLPHGLIEQLRSIGLSAVITQEGEPTTQGDSPPPVDLCLKCERPADDFIHDDPHGLGGTGTYAMHPFIGMKEKLLLQLARNNVYMRTRSRPKGGKPTEAMEKWNEAIADAVTAIERMYGRIDSAELARHDQYWAKEYAARKAGAAS